MALLMVNKHFISVLSLSHKLLTETFGLPGCEKNVQLALYFNKILNSRRNSSRIGRLQSIKTKTIFLTNQYLLLLIFT